VTVTDMPNLDNQQQFPQKTKQADKQAMNGKQEP
jgi:hypothetical protein